MIPVVSASLAGRMSVSEEQLADLLAGCGYAVIDRFLSANEVTQLRSLLFSHQQHGNLKQAGIGSAHHQVNRNIRGDQILWIDQQQDLEKGVAPDHQPMVAAYLKLLRELLPLLNRQLFLGLKDAEVHFARYAPGTFYKRHLDQFKENDHRKLSVICYLNQDWQPEDGGQLRLYLPLDGGAEKVVDLAPEAGRLVIFRSDMIEHEVLAAQRDRYSITGWLLDRPAGVSILGI